MIIKTVKKYFLSFIWSIKTQMFPSSFHQTNRQIYAPRCVYKQSICSNNKLTNYHTMHQRYITVENIVRKRRNCLQQAISPILTMFLPYMVLIFHFRCTLKCRLQPVSVWNSVKFCRLVMGESLIYVYIRTDLSASESLAHLHL